jgi:hypothetical protein
MPKRPAVVDGSKTWMQAIPRAWSIGRAVVPSLFMGSSFTYYRAAMGF